MKMHRFFALCLILICSLLLICACATEGNTIPEQQVIDEPAEADTATDNPPVEDIVQEPEAEPQPEAADETEPVPASEQEQSEHEEESSTQPADTNETEAAPADAIITISGSGVEQEIEFSLADLQGINAGVATADYFYKGKDPEQGTETYTGVLLSYLVDNHIRLKPEAKKLTITSADGYAVVYSLSAVRATYIDENVPGKALYMMLAWKCDGTDIESVDGSPLKLIMGQQIAGEYNRTNWVRNVVKIEVF